MKDDDDERALFREAVQNVNKLVQDTIVLRTNRDIKRQTVLKTEKINEHCFYFSDDYVPLLKDDGPTRFARDDVPYFELKMLRKGTYPPDVFLDLHGMTQKQAKKELAAMIQYCLTNDYACACISHGIGMGILKEKTPQWLVQHPSILAFHQAPLEFGGQGSLLVLLQVRDDGDPKYG